MRSQSATGCFGLQFGLGHGHGGVARNTVLAIEIRCCSRSGAHLIVAMAAAESQSALFFVQLLSWALLLFACAHVSCKSKVHMNLACCSELLTNCSSSVEFSFQATDEGCVH